MRGSVRDAWLAFTERFEGKVNHFYLDTRGLVTIGFGNLQDPGISPLLDFRSKITGEDASVTDVRAEWARMKSLRGALVGGVAIEKLGGGAF